MRYLLLVLLCIPVAVYGQPDIAAIEPVQKLAVLNNKAFFQFPTGAEQIARQTDIMSADPNAERETRVVLDVGEKRMVFFAEELYATAGDNLADGIRSTGGKDFTITTLDRTDSLLVVLSTPKTFDTTKNAILINSLFVRTQDKTIFRMNAYINPPAFKDQAAFRVLSERVFRTITKGNRGLNTKERTEVIAVLGGHKIFSVDLPRGYIISKDQKYDFEVLRFRKIKDFFDTSFVSLNVYLGHHPSYFYRSYNLEESRQQKVQGLFLGKEREWMLFKEAEQHLFLKEQQFPAPDLEEGLIIHVAMTADRMPVIDALSDIVSTIKFVKE